MFTIIWKKSANLSSKLDSIKSRALALKDELGTAEQGAQAAVENLVAELGSIKALKTALSKMV